MIVLGSLGIFCLLLGQQPSSDLKDLSERIDQDWSLMGKDSWTLECFNGSSGMFQTRFSESPTTRLRLLTSIINYVTLVTQSLQLGLAPKVAQDVNFRNGSTTHMTKTQLFPFRTGCPETCQDFRSSVETVGMG